MGFGLFGGAGSPPPPPPLPPAATPPTYADKSVQAAGTAARARARSAAGAGFDSTLFTNPTEGAAAAPLAQKKLLGE